MDYKDDFDERIVNEFRETSHIWSKLAGGIAGLSLVALAVFLVIGDGGGAALCGFLAVMFGMMSFGSWIFYRKILADTAPAANQAAPAISQAGVDTSETRTGGSSHDR